MRRLLPALALLALPASARAMELRPTLLAQTQLDLHSDEGPIENGFQLARLRLGMRVEPTAWFLAVATVEVSGEGGELTPYEAYVEATAARSWHFSVGLRRTPLFATARSEHVESMPVPERSLPVKAMWPGVDLGVEVHYTPETLPVEAWLRLGNGSRSVSGNDSDHLAGDARVDLVLGRARPGSTAPYGLRLGLGGHAKDRETTRSLTATTADGFLFTHAVPTFGWQTIGEAHAGVWLGRLTGTLEGGIAREERSRVDPSAPDGRAAQAPISTRGGALELAWMLLGAPREPGRWPGPASLEGWHGGNVELAARLERVELTSGAPDVRPGGAEGGSLAIDWWATSFASLSVAGYGLRYFTPPIETPTETHAWLVLARATVSIR